MRPRDSKKQKTAADATNVAQLPSDILPGILLRVPASDLRRFRRVCKEWRDIISDLSFIDAHMVHGLRAPTHTIVFYPGRTRSQADSLDEPLSGGGFLFDEQWRLTARFTVNESAEMIGTCKGLLCFRDSVHGVIMVVEPFTGDSIVLPLPPTADAGTCSTAAYCFGFDPTARRYKIVHSVFQGEVIYDGYLFPPSTRSTVKQELRVFTVGADTEWRTVLIRGARHGMLYDDPACDGGAVYWYSQGYHVDHYYRNVRFDLTTEKITSRLRRLVNGVIPCRYSSPVFSELHIVGIRWFGEANLKDGCWSNNIDAVAHETYCVRHSTGRSLPGPRALQRGHLLLTRHKEGDLHAHPIVRSSVSSLDTGYWDSKPLIEIGSVEEEPAERYRFFPVHRRTWGSSEAEVPMIGRLPPKHGAITTFAYGPTLRQCLQLLLRYT